MGCMVYTCPGCGDEYERLGKHWSGSPEHIPELTHKQHQITTGILMGDASVSTCNKHARITMQTITPEYLDYLSDSFGIFGLAVQFYKTASEQAKRARESGFSEGARAENYSDVYQWNTRSIPEFDEYVGWYESGEKVFPDNIDLSPTVLKHWYVCDGYLYKDLNRLVISISNEVDNTDKIDSMFERAGLPTPAYDVQTRKDGTTKCNARWEAKHTNSLLEYMGDPLPGFEYKWR